jgi:hypothetical protein
VIVAQKLVQEVDGFAGDIALIIGSDESHPWFSWISARSVEFRSRTYTTSVRTCR